LPCKLIDRDGQAAMLLRIVKKKEEGYLFDLQNRFDSKYALKTGNNPIFFTTYNMTRRSAQYRLEELLRKALVENLGSKEGQRGQDRICYRISELGKKALHEYLMERFSRSDTHLGQALLFDCVQCLWDADREMLLDILTVRMAALKGALNVQPSLFPEDDYANKAMLEVHSSNCRKELEQIELLRERASILELKEKWKPDGSVHEPMGE